MIYKLEISYGYKWVTLLARKKAERLKPKFQGGFILIAERYRCARKDKSGHADLLGYLLCIPCAEDVIRMKHPFLSVLTFFIITFRNEIQLG